MDAGLGHYVHFFSPRGKHSAKRLKSWLKRSLWRFLCLALWSWRWFHEAFCSVTFHSHWTKGWWRVQCQLNETLIRMKYFALQLIKELDVCFYVARVSKRVFPESFLVIKGVLQSVTLSLWCICFYECVMHPYRLLENTCLTTSF